MTQQIRQTQLTKLQSSLKNTLSNAMLEVTPLPKVPEISLALISEDYPKGPLPYEEMLAVLEQPAYWAFCWASGQVLARYLLDHPEFSRGKSVLDLGSGSGVVAIAARLAGASKVVACDLDPEALDSVRVNAQLNNVEIETLIDLGDSTEHYDVIMAADVLYDRENLPLLTTVENLCHEIIIADSRIRDPAVFANYEHLSRIEATTVPDLDELKEYGLVNLYRRAFS